jgi:Mrp family chromosome partitioning ATPase
MKIPALPLLAIAVAVLSAPVPQKAVIITYPENTPHIVIETAIETIDAAGGLITHEYKLIK